MPWPTTSGERNLIGAEANLMRGAIGMMVDALVAEARDESGPVVYGVSWFDQWDVEQRLWLLEHVTGALFGSLRVEPAAMFDATVDAVLFEVLELIEIEIEDFDGPLGKSSWRQSVVDAFACQQGRVPEIEIRSRDVTRWSRVVSQIGDQILGVRLYQRAEAFRDVGYDRTCVFLRDRGLPEHYLSQIPPLGSVDRAQLSIDRIQQIVFDRP